MSTDTLEGPNDNKNRVPGDAKNELESHCVRPSPGSSTLDTMLCEHTLVQSFTFPDPNLANAGSIGVTVCFWQRRSTVSHSQSFFQHETAFLFLGTHLEQRTAEGSFSQL